MNQKLLVATAVFTLSLGTSLSVQAQTAPTTGTTTTTPGTTNSISAPSIFTPGVNPSGSIDYTRSTNLPGSPSNPSGFTVPSNTLSQPNSVFNNPNSNNSIYNNSNSIVPNRPVNAFPPYDPYKLNRSPSIYNPSIGNPNSPFRNPNSTFSNPNSSLSNPTNGSGTIRR